MAEASLRRLYEDPATPLSSGQGRAERQAAMLAQIASALGVRWSRSTSAAETGCAPRSRWLSVSPRQGLGGHHRDGLVDGCAQAGTSTYRPVARASADEGGLPLADSSVDIVIMSELIEHLVDPDRHLDEAWRVLRPGGTLLLSTPNLAAWYNRVLLACGIQPLFTEVSLRGIYGRPGTEVVGSSAGVHAPGAQGLLSAIGFVDVQIKGAPTTTCRAH